jgi:large conductance mechanosensitive channel
MLKEFRDFIAQGNALELAIGVIVGVAFGAVVNSLVNDVLMQIIGQPSFDAVSTRWGNKLTDATAVAAVQGKHPGLESVYEHQTYIGTFITTIINFLIIAFVIFLVVKAVSRLRKPRIVEEAPAGPTVVQTAGRDPRRSAQPLSGGRDWLGAGRDGGV